MNAMKSFKCRLSQYCRKYKVQNKYKIQNTNSKRHFFVRASEHLRITPLTGEFLKTSKKSSIFDHMLLDGHKASFDNFSILLKESNLFKL